MSSECIFATYYSSKVLKIDPDFILGIIQFRLTHSMHTLLLDFLSFQPLKDDQTQKSSTVCELKGATVHCISDSSFLYLDKKELAFGSNPLNTV